MFYYKSEHATGDNSLNTDMSGSNPQYYISGPSSETMYRKNNTEVPFHMRLSNHIRNTSDVNFINKQLTGDSNYLDRLFDPTGSRIGEDLETRLPSILFKDLKKEEGQYLRDSGMLDPSLKAFKFG